MNAPSGAVAATQWPVAVTQWPVSMPQPPEFSVWYPENSRYIITPVLTRIYRHWKKMKTILSLLILTIAIAARSQTNPAAAPDRVKLITITNTIHMYATNCDALAVRIQRLGFLADAAKQARNPDDAQKYGAEQTKLMNQYAECERRISVLTQEADRIKGLTTH